MTTSDELAADPHVAALLAHVPGVALRVDLDQKGGAWAYVIDGRPIVTVCADLAEGDRWPLYGSLAHELSHHILGHFGDSWPRRLMAGAQWVAHVSPLVAAFAAGGGHWAVTALLLTLSAATLLAGVQVDRWQERAADAKSVPLLIASGLPGAAVAEASLMDGPPESRWERAAGWAWSSHPLAAERIRLIRSLTSR